MRAFTATLLSLTAVGLVFFGGFAVAGQQANRSLPLPSAVEPPAADLLFSEYIEGSGSDKAIEILNATGASVDLSAYSVDLYANGRTEAQGPTSSEALSGTLADGDVYVIGNSAAAAAITSVSDITSSVTFFNGDDALVLRKNGTPVDVIGQVGTDPGSEWGSGDASTANNTIRRKADACTGDTVIGDAFDPATDYDGFPSGTFGDLGSYSGNCGGGGALPGAIINEFVVEHTGVDNSEYFEIAGDASTDYSDLSIVVVDGDIADIGSVDDVIAVGSTDANGYWWSGFLTNGIEGGTNTFFLVRGFTGAQGDDLDTNNDGTLDVEPWTEVLDVVAVDDGATGDVTYATPVLTPNFDGGTVKVSGASRLPDATDTDASGDWTRNDFDGAGIASLDPGTPEAGEALNTPGTENMAASSGGGPVAFTSTLPSAFIGAGAAVNFDYDATGSGLTFTLVEGPSGATINAASGVFSWAGTTTVGVYPVRVSVTDGSDTDMVTTVLGVQGTLYDGETGATLRASIRGAYTPNQTLGYDVARDTLYGVVDREPNGDVVGVYTGLTVNLPDGEDPSSFLFSNDLNTEHTWPQSKGAGSEPQRSDMHHLFATKVNVNSARGSLPLTDIVDANTDTWFRLTQSQTSIPTMDIDEWSESNTSAFEPREVHKGNAARASVYFYTIYESAADASFLPPQQSAFIAWDAADPADVDELVRSYEISLYQGNVNPFVLDPTLLDRAVETGGPPPPPGGAISMSDARGQANGASVIVEGIVTRAEGRFVRFQDLTAGLTVFEQTGPFRSAVDAGTISEGDSLRVSGTMGEFNGLRQISPASFAVLNSNNPLPAAQVVSLADLISGGEDFESELVRVNGLTISTSDVTFAAGTSYTVGDGFDTLTLRTPNADDGLIDGTPIPVGSVYFLGVVSQFGADYQLQPVLASDVSATPAEADLVLTGVEGYRMLAYPSGTYNDLLADIWTQGFTGSDNPSGGCSVFSFDETVGDFDSAYSCIADQGAAFTRGAGAYVYVFEDDDLSTNGVQGGFPKDLDVMASGVSAPFSAFPLTYTDNPETPAFQEGFNFLGNPLATGFDWDLAVRGGGLSATIYVFDPNYLGGNYRTWTAGLGGDLTDGIVPAYQGFFAKAIAANPTLEVPVAAVVAPGPNVYGKDAPGDPLRFEVVHDGEPVSVGFVAVSPEASLGDDAFDAYRLTPAAWPRTVLSTRSIGDDSPLALNALPASAEGEIEVPLEISAEGHQTGPLALSLAWSGALPEGWSVTLVDRHTGETTPVLDGGSVDIHLTVASGAAKAGTVGLDLSPFATPAAKSGTFATTGDRFVLRFTPALSTSTSPEASGDALALLAPMPNPARGAVTLTYTVPEAADVHVAIYDALGREVAAVASGTHAAGRHTTSVDLGPLAPGVYVARVTSGAEASVQRFTVVR